METKPYRIQSPEDIAKDYAGNKQKIAQAMQLGVVDPTAGVLAGMFIDRMRSAQMQEVAPQRTVAQQIMGPPPAPMGAPAAPMGPPAGLGATPEAAMMAEQMPPMQPPMPETPPQEAPIGMAAGGMFEAPYMKDGGLSELPVPDGMFDENRDGAYANGGIVAFARGGTGGMSNLYDDVEYWESGGDQGAVSKAGARGVMQLMPGTMRDPGFGVPSVAELMAKGLNEEEANRQSGQKYLDAMYRRYGDQATALAAYNWGPGNVDKWLKNGADPKKLPTETKNYISNVMKGTEPPIREADIDTARGRAISLEDSVGLAQRYLKPSEEELAADEKMRARLTEMGSDEYYEKQRKDSMWETLATIGFNMASSKAPGVLQAIGEAAAAALPGARADKKERKELKDRALDGLVALGARNRQRANEAFKVGVDIYKSGAEAEEAEKLMAYRYDALRSQREEGALDRESAEERQRIAATSRDTMFEQLASNFKTQISERIAQGLPIRRASGQGFITFPKGKKPTDAEIQAIANEMAVNELQRARSTGTTGTSAADAVRDLTGARAGSAGSETVDLGSI